MRVKFTPEYFREGIGAYKVNGIRMDMDNTPCPICRNPMELVGAETRGENAALTFACKRCPTEISTIASSTYKRIEK